ncbi:MULTISPECIES: PAAR domain-containing protein [unclassified Phaeobacter]|uniref:PAAR domain-containing protein n=1 Tax=unclassified Phaeobacter TaxID=2621772 RepID=UPI003A88EF62
MPKAARKTDSCTGHADFPSRPATGGSPNVEIEGLAALRQGDSWATHCNPEPLCHGASQATGSSTVFVNGKPLARVGDAVGCGSSIATGAETVIVGG